MALSFHEQMIVELTNEFKRAPGVSVQERTDFVLAQHGWDKELAGISDEFRTVIRHSLERLALSPKPAESPRNIEKDRYQKETEKLAVLGTLGDLFSDQYVGFKPEELAAKLPRESYWVQSLGKHVAREELAFQLGVVAELRAQAHIELLKIQQIANVHRHELAIFDELLRQSAGRPADKNIGSKLEGAHG